MIDVLEIRRRAGGGTCTALAQEFRVGKDTISKISRRKTWRGIAEADEMT